jgi:MFS family permease
MGNKRIITKTIWMLSMVSLFTDIASEMLYPVMPIYLKSIHFSIVMIGILEGLAEATAGISKGYFGRWSDNLGRRLPFVRAGYAMSALSKPMMAFFTYPVYIFCFRTMDRLGKGIRTGARDAMLSDEATSLTKGTVFGFHRSMDTWGAVLGPLAALLFLYIHPGKYRDLFYLAFVPGILAVCLTLFIREKQTPAGHAIPKTGFFEFLNYWRNSPAFYRKLLTGLLVFALFNSSDVFLLLKIKEAGFSDTKTIGVYVFYNFFYALSAYPLGVLADRLGLKNIFVSGLILFAIVYAGMALNHSLSIFFALFLLYGLYAAATEGVAKAWISNICDPKDTATAIGTYTAFQSICTLVASSLTGFLWFRFGSTVALAVIALAACVATLYFLSLKPEAPKLA